MIDATVLVIAKEPIAGLVKTRLCPPCEPGEAAAIARAALADTLATVASVAVRRRVVVLDGAPGAWLPAGFHVVPQCAGGLADRLAAAFAAVEGPAFLVGMDTPQLTRAQIERACRALHAPRVDAVIGRAEDGGFWGIGLRRADPRAFDGVPMSTDRTGAHQIARLGALSLRIRELATMRDVDHFADARAIASLVPGSAFAAVVATVERAIEHRAWEPAPTP